MKSRDSKKDFTLVHCLFGAEGLTQNVEPDKNGYSNYGVGFDTPSRFSLANGELSERVFIFGEDNSSSRNAANRKKEILVFGEDPADGLDGTTITAEAEFSISITKSRKSICVSLHYNANNSFLHANGVNISHFKANILK